MSSKSSACVVGIDVGGTNTDAVILQNDAVLAWHKTPTTTDIQSGVEQAIEQVVKKAGIPFDGVDYVKIGTTQFVNAVLEQDSRKLDKVAAIRLCGPYSRGSPPFVEFPPTLRNLLGGYFSYVDGGYQVDGTPISSIKESQLKEQASIIKSKSITSVVVMGIYSPSNPAQEEEARSILVSELGPGYDVSCSYTIGRLGFLERENASILNASIRRFARFVIAGLSYAVRNLSRCTLYITQNDGTLSKASSAADYPVRCFSSGPTNSARGAARLARTHILDNEDDRELLVVDVGGTTTDICSLLKTGYPRQSAPFVKIAGVRTNFTIPDVHSIALGGGSIVRVNEAGRTSIGPDSVGARLGVESIGFGGPTLTATDLARTSTLYSELHLSGLEEVSRLLEEAIDLIKTKQGDARVILVGGGSIIVGNHITGVGQLIRPKYLEVANAVGAAIGKISGAVEKIIIPGARTMEQEIEDTKVQAIHRCIAAGGSRETIEVIEVEVVPISYVANGATRLLVRVVGDLIQGPKESCDTPTQLLNGEPFSMSDWVSILPNGISENAISKASCYHVIDQVDLKSYRPRIEGDLWYLSETDLQFLLDGTGVLGVGSCGEPYPSYLACILALRAGEDIKIMRQDTLADDAVVLVAGFMGSPSVYLERIPGLHEVTDAMRSVLSTTGIADFTAVIPNEIGGLNAFEALLAAHRFQKSTLDTDLVARAYPKVWQTVRCLQDISITPSAVADGAGNFQIFENSKDNYETEVRMREACTGQGNLSGMCISPVLGKEARTLPNNSFSHAWTIGRSIALSRSLKVDPITTILSEQNGILLFTGKIISVTRNVAEGFTRGSVLLSSTSASCPSSKRSQANELFVEFENENLSAILRNPGATDKVLACCPDLITFLDIANVAPVGIADYKYGLRVTVIALRAPPIWTTERGLEIGGPKAFGMEMDYKGVSNGEYKTPKSVWDMFGESAKVM